MAADTMTLNEAAEHLGVHYMTVYRWVRTGKLAATKDGVEWRVSVTDLERVQNPAPVRRSRQSREEQASRLEARLVAGDENGAWSAIESALAGGMTPDEIYLELLVPALASIGERWAVAELDVAEEHRATAVAHRLIGRLGPQFRRRGRRRGTVLVGSPSGERHGIPSAVAADILRGRNFDVIDLGPDTPAESFVHAAVTSTRLRLIGIAVTLPEVIPEARQVIASLRAAGIDVPISLGGAAIPSEEQALALGADFYTGMDGSTAVDRLTEAAGGVIPPSS